MATTTYKTSDWATVRVTTNADWSRSATVVNSGSSGISSWTTYSTGSNSSGWNKTVTVSNSNYGGSGSSQSFNNMNDAINYSNTAYKNTNTNTTPTINLWDLWKFGADAYNTPNFNIDARNDAIIKWLGANATNEAAVRNYLMSNQSFANASTTDQQNTINSILRKAATVATAENPVVDYLADQNQIVFDINDPQDYLDRLQARTALTGQQLTQEEYYNMLKAQRAIQQQQYKNPYEDYMKQLQQQLTEAQARERERDEAALRSYQSRLDSQYWDLINQQRQWWQASQQSAQNVYSFSGFGRSSAAANKAAEIQDTTNRAIQALNQQKLAEIELKRAELEWADWDELTYLKNQMNTLSQATTEWQLQALSQMAQANAQAGNDAVTSITNMLAAAANSWIDITWDGYERIITAFNWMTPEQQDAYLSTLNPTDQLLVLWWAANSADWNYKFVSATKYQKAWYFNEKTWEFFPLSWGGSYGWGGGWWSYGWWGGSFWSITAISNELDQLAASTRWWRNLSQSQAETLSAWTQLPAMLSQLKSALEDASDKLWPVKWRLNTLNPYDTTSQTLQSLLKQTTQLVWTFMEWWKLTDADFAKYEKFLPKMSDTYDSAISKLNSVTNTLSSQYNNTLRSYANAWYDVSSFSSIKNNTSSNNTVNNNVSNNQQVDDLSWLPDWTIIEDDATWKQYQIKNGVPVEIKTSNWSSKLTNAVVKVWTWILKKLLK